MRIVRTLLSLLMVTVILLAFAKQANAMDFEAESAYESIFVIYSGDSLGSGFAIGENCIVTNAHVIEDRSRITAKSYSGKEFQVSVLGINENEDIAVLVTDAITFPYLPVADLSSIKIGDDIYAIGAPKGMAYTLTKGSISAKDRAVGNNSYIQIDAAINEGNSGGPLLNISGQVIGMNSLKLSDSEGIGLAIPISRICEYISSLGVALDTGGNISGYVDVPKVPVSNEPADNKKSKVESRNDGNLSAVTIALIVIAALSIIGNIVMLILLMRNKNKKAIKQYDPRERTDFDIEMLE